MALAHFFGENHPVKTCTDSQSSICIHHFMHDLIYDVVHHFMHNLISSYFLSICGFVILCIFFLVHYLMFHFICLMCHLIPHLIFI